MDEMCLVFCGAWVCGSDGKWEFMVDKNRMARMIPVDEGITMRELERRVLVEFNVSGRYDVALSYWPPDSLGLATGIKTPHVLLTSDGALKYFFSHMKVIRGSLNLFATYERLVVDVSKDDNGIGFETPVCGKSGVGVGMKRKGINVSSVGSKTSFIDLDDEDLVNEVEKFEERMRSESNPHVGGSSSGLSGVDRTVSEDGHAFDDIRGTSEGLESDYIGPQEVDERDVRPRGYDYDFWSPLLEGDFGGSNAVELVFNDKDASGVIKGEDARWAYIPGVASGAENSEEVPMDDFSWMGKTTLGGCGNRGQETGGWGGNKRMLKEVDDEEFDIPPPPLYDDNVYEAAEIPRLDVSEADGVVHVGKVYGSKVDCQIALAIYAIKRQIQFKKTRTKVGSFVCECSDTRCDWRVTAHEIKGAGYYEIRKAQLEHSCPIESRNEYMKRGTAKVIAAVYKAKFKDPNVRYFEILF